MCQKTNCSFTKMLYVAVVRLFWRLRTTNRPERTRAELARAGAESVDAARDEWWIGRDAENEHYKTRAVASIWMKQNAVWVLIRFTS